MSQNAPDNIPPADTPPNENEQFDVRGNIGPWILKSFNELNSRLDGIDKNIKWLNRLAWFIMACIGIFLFVSIMFVRPAIPFVLNKLFPP